MINDIEKDLENDKNNPDVLRALDYINSQKSTSISLYQT